LLLFNVNYRLRGSVPVGHLFRLHELAVPFHDALPPHYYPRCGGLLGQGEHLGFDLF
jgi:hypothetical protein